MDLHGAHGYVHGQATQDPQGTNSGKCDWEGDGGHTQGSELPQGAPWRDSS